jgi:hypothetical protein
VKLGIKVANDQKDIQRLKKTGAKLCEVRFILEKKEEFTPILDY